MNLQRKIIFILFVAFFSTSTYAKQKNELLFYIGITMVKPVSQLAKNFEKANNCKIKILQGGSEDLYQSIKSSKVGDLYLPGSLSYRNKYLNEGLLLDGKFVGYNKLALVVKKGNPKNIKPSLSELTNENLKVVLGSDNSSSVGKASKNILIKYKLYRETVLNSLYFASDSRNLINAIKNDKADLVLNWYATTFWNDNSKYVEAIELEDKYSKKSKLVFNLLSTSKNRELSKKFMEYASSKEGQMVFKNYGFLSEKDLKDFDKVSF